MSLPRNIIMLGDAALRLAQLPDAAIDCIVTSPPYFRLRNYGVSGQLGLEPHIDDWVSGLVSVLDEAQRVLVPTGTVWLNLGDSFSTHEREGSARKSLLLGPERVALALTKRGWLIRNKIVWAKPNTTPTSVKDRLATKHEVIYLLARSPSYFFDLDAIREPHTSVRATRSSTPTETRRVGPDWLGPNSDGDGGLRAMHAAGLVGHPLGKNPGDVWTVAVSTFRGAHFATYPTTLAERMVTAGCPKRRCVTCRRPWVEPLERSGTTAKRLGLRPTCDCAGDWEPGIVLDPFMGAGTTALAAEALGRDWLGIELNPAYRQLALDRLATARGDPLPDAA